MAVLLAWKTERAMTAKKHCLIIDDSEVIREIGARIATDLGFDAESVESAAAAIEHCSERHTNVVLLDWDLPSMGALDFLRGAVELGEERRPEIILCATENDPQQFTLARAAGARHHILKPFDRDAVALKFAEVGLIDHAAQPNMQAANSERR